MTDDRWTDVERHVDQLVGGEVIRMDGMRYRVDSVFDTSTSEKRIIAWDGKHRLDMTLPLDSVLTVWILDADGELESEQTLPKPALRNWKTSWHPRCEALSYVKTLEDRAARAEARVAELESEVTTLRDYLARSRPAGAVANRHDPGVWVSDKEFERWVPPEGYVSVHLPREVVHQWASVAPEKHRPSIYHATHNACCKALEADDE